MSAVLINPGSGPVLDSGDGWTNSYQGAQKEAARWLESMHKEGIYDVDVVDYGPGAVDGRWRFGFVHAVTGVEVILETHGIDNMDAFMKKFIFGARVYWKGSSSGTPELSDWAAPGFVQTFRPEVDHD